MTQLKIIIANYYHTAKAISSSRYDRMQATKKWMVENHFDLIVKCFPPRNKEDKFSNKSLWLFIEDTLS